MTRYQHSRDCHLGEWCGLCETRIDRADDQPGWDASTDRRGTRAERVYERQIYGEAS